MPPLNRGHGRSALQTLRSTALGLTYVACRVWRKIRTHLDLLSILQSGGKNVKTFRWDYRLQIQNPFNDMAFKRVRSPMIVTLGQQYNIGVKPTVILYTYINRHAGTPEKQRRQKSTLSNMVIIIYCYIIGFEDEVTTLKREQRGPWCRYLHTNTESTRHRYSPGRRRRRRAVGDHTRK